MAFRGSVPRETSLRPERRSARWVFRWKYERLRGTGGLGRPPEAGAVSTSCPSGIRSRLTVSAYQSSAIKTRPRHPLVRSRTHAAGFLTGVLGWTVNYLPQLCVRTLTWRGLQRLWRPPNDASKDTSPRVPVPFAQVIAYPITEQPPAWDRECRQRKLLFISATSRAVFWIARSRS
jgi:hypothetical protein